MKREKLIRNLDKLIEQTEEEAFNRGYSDGLEDGKFEGWNLGVDSSKDFVRFIMEQSIELSMNANKLRDAKATKDIMDWLFARWNYDPEEAERRQREEEENSDGFGLIL